MHQRSGIKLSELQQHRALFAQLYRGWRRSCVATTFKAAARTVYLTKVKHG